MIGTIHLTPGWTAAPKTDPRPDALWAVSPDPAGLGAFKLELAVTVDDRGRRMMFAFNAREGEPDLGDEGRVNAFGVRLLGPGVWTIAPCLHLGALNAYVTLCGVEDVPQWRPKDPTG